jgi:rubredoxin
MLRRNHLIKINLPGGIISAGDFYSIVTTAEKAGVRDIQFGTRQQVFFRIADIYLDELSNSLAESGIQFEVNTEKFPNIVSSYVCENVFGNANWLSEGLYKDILEEFDYQPTLKVNIVDRDQTFVPFFTGNINFIASALGNYWYLYIRFPKTTILYRWKVLIYTQDIPRISKLVEEIILIRRDLFFDQPSVNGDMLYSLVRNAQDFFTQNITEELSLPDFTLPYYEGFNRYDDKSWLGIYRRDELFPLKFLKDVCMICMQTKIGQLYTTPWKTLVLKGIEHADRKLWDYVLGKYRINVRHASNELNWQVEDNCEEGLNLKGYLIRQFDKDDVRTFGLCFAIKTQPRSGLFGSIIIRKLLNGSANQRKTLDRYDILYTKDFNPNSKDFIVFRKNIEKENLGVYLISLCKYFYELQSEEELIVHHVYREEILPDGGTSAGGVNVFQCKHCLTVYDEQYGDSLNGIAAGTTFMEMNKDYQCPTCHAPKDDFVEVQKMPLIV